MESEVETSNQKRPRYSTTRSEYSYATRPGEISDEDAELGDDDESSIFDHRTPDRRLNLQVSQSNVPSIENNNLSSHQFSTPTRPLHSGTKFLYTYIHVYYDGHSFQILHTTFV